LHQLEHVLETGDSAAYVALLEPTASSETREQVLVDWVVPGITRAVVHERMRAPSQNVPDGAGYDLYVDVLAESGRRGRVGTWLLIVRRDSPPAAGWRISALTVLTTMRGLYRLQLNAAKEFSVTNLTLSRQDLEVGLPERPAFDAATQDGITRI